MKHFFFTVLLVMGWHCSNNCFMHAQENTSGPFQYKDTNSILEAIEYARDLLDSLPAQAKTILNHTSRHSKEMHFNDGVALSLTLSGKILIAEGRYQEAVSSMQQALQYRPSAGYLWYVYNNMGNAYNYSGQLERAADAYMQAIGHMPERSDEVVPLCYVYTNFCTVLYQLGQYDKALIYIDKALPVAKVEKQYDAYASLLGLKALNYAYKKDKLRAELYFDTALAFARKFKDYRNEYNILMNKSNFFLQTGNAPKALAILQEGKDVFHHNFLKLSDTLKFLRAMGQTYLQLDKTREAEQYLLQAWQAARQMPKERLWLSQKLSEVYEKTGNAGRSLAYLQEHLRLKDSVQGKEIALAVSGMETRYRSAEKDKQIAQSQLLISNQKRKIARKNLWIATVTGTAGLLALLFTGLYFFLRQKNKLLTSRQKIAQLHARIEGEEEERRRIAQELHDGINSQLVGIRGCLDALGHNHPTVQASGHFGMMQQMLNNTSTDLRQTAHNLWPLAIIQKGLVAAIRDFCSQLNKQGQLRIEYQAYGDFDQLDTYLSLNILRIIQELLHNVVKHAAATEAVVLLNNHARDISLIVEDNGCGINQARLKNGSGLNSVAKRVAAHDGHMQIEQAGSKGTLVNIVLFKTYSPDKTHVQHS